MKTREFDKRIEELQKGTTNDIFEFAERMEARWNKPRESLQKASGENFTSTEAQSNRDAPVHGDTKENPYNSVLQFHWRL